MSDRATFLAGSAAAAVCVALPNAAFAQTALLPIKIGTYLADTGAQPFFGDVMGFFKKAGLDAQTTVLSSGSALVPAVISTSLDVGCSTIGTIAAAVEHGLPLVVFAAGGMYSTSQPTTVIVVEGASPIKTAKDLNGKKIGVNGLKDLIYVATQEWIARNGGDLSTIKFVEIPFPEQGPALQRGTVDAIAGAEPAVSIAKLRYGARALGFPYDIVNDKKPFLISAWFSTADWLKMHGDLAKRYVAALAETARWANANRGRSGDILAQHIELAPDVLRVMARTEFATTLDPAAIQPALDISYRAKFLSTPIAAAALLPKA